MVHNRHSIRLKPQPGPVPPGSGSVGSIIGAYKSTTARLINGIRHTPGTPVWQHNNYEHIIRNNHEQEKITTYIKYNPINWKKDQKNLLKAEL